MAKFKALEKFRLLDDPKVAGKGKIYEENDEIDMTIKRAELLEKNLGKKVVERIEEEK